ncbi:MAG: polymer-forming cytoskeletal protein [Verrucomicrobiales bacterium]
MLKKIISTTNEDDYAAEEPAAEPDVYAEPEAAQPSYGSSPSYPETSYSSSPSQMSRNILSSDVKIKGSISFGEELILDAAVEGEVNSDAGHLTVGENARVKGEIKTRAVIVYGKIDGNLTVTERCELKADAEIVGDIRAGTLSIEEGAAFMGQSSVGAAAVASAKSGSSSSPSGKSGSSSSPSSSSPAK